MISPTQRTLATLREEGWVCAMVEHFNPHVRIRQDLYGFADIIAFNEEEVLLVQCTSGSNVSSRIAKVCASDIAKAWAVGPARRIEVWGWAKRGARGARKAWTVRRVRLYAARTLNGIEWTTEADASESETP